MKNQVISLESCTRVETQRFKPHATQTQIRLPRGKSYFIGGSGITIIDGQVDTVGIIDMTLNPPRVIDAVVVGDGPEGLAMSPAGGYAASLILNGSGPTPKTAFYRHDHSYVALLKIAGKKVTIEVTDPNMAVYKCDLTLDGNKLAGDVVLSAGGQVVKAKLELTRVE